MDESIRNIEKLKAELQQLGYHSFQIDGVIREVAHTTALQAMTQEQLQEVTDTLASYINFAVKCHSNRLQ